MIVFNCPHCGKTYELADAVGGKTVPCNKCRQPMTVPFKGTVVTPGKKPLPPAPAPSQGAMMPGATPTAAPQAPYPQPTPPQQPYQQPMAPQPMVPQQPLGQQYPIGNPMQPQGFVQAGVQANPYQQPQVNVSVNTQTPPSYRRQQEEGNGMATASLICGICGFFLFGIILGPLAIIFGAIGMSKEEKRGSAVTGMIMGIVDIIGWVIVMSML